LLPFRITPVIGAPSRGTASAHAEMEEEPGARYGWPKNTLHWKGIQESILDLHAIVPIHFGIADGIVAMEGNGPFNGDPHPLGKIVLADDPVAAASASGANNLGRGAGPETTLTTSLARLFPCRPLVSDNVLYRSLRGLRLRPGRPDSGLLSPWTCCASLDV
jgi:hypothetical protein